MIFLLHLIFFSQKPHRNHELSIVHFSTVATPWLNRHKPSLHSKLHSFGPPSPQGPFITLFVSLQKQNPGRWQNPLWPQPSGHFGALQPLSSTLLFDQPLQHSCRFVDRFIHMFVPRGSRVRWREYKEGDCRLAEVQSGFLKCRI